MLETTILEKIKTHIFYSVIFSENRAVVEKYGTVRKATGDNVIRGMHLACRINKARINTHTHNF
jgi:hypothetical protein